MQENRLHRNVPGEAFHQKDAPVLATRALCKSSVIVTELRCEHRNFGRTSTIPPENAYLIALQLRACPDHDLYFEGRFTRPENYGRGVTSIYDLRRAPAADLRDPFHCLMFYLPRAALDMVARDAGMRPGLDLRHQPGTSVNDPVVRSLLSSLEPLMARPELAHPLFLDHVAMALTTHIACRYGGVDIRAVARPGCLAPWQERRAKEILSANLQDAVPVAQLAAECELSPRHFARAFRASTGMPPHRWLLQHRVARAREMLDARVASLAEIAQLCGFADQSHFTRVFTGIVGATPAAWQRSSRAVAVTLKGDDARQPVD